MKRTKQFFILITIILLSYQIHAYVQQWYPVKANKTIVMLNTTFHVELPVNPATGYTWHLIDSFDPRLLKLTSKRFEPNPDTPEHVIAPGGKEIFALRAVRRGSPRIRFELRRFDQNRNQPAAQVKEFVIRIK